MRFAFIMLAATTATAADGPDNIRLLGVTSTQAIVAYTAPDNNPCKLFVSENASIPKPVHDVDADLFSGSDKDDREGSVFSGRERTIVIGKRIAEVARDGRRYSRALKALTPHTYQITCGGVASAPQVFRTENIGLGNSYANPPFDRSRPGEYAYPTIDFADKSKSYIDPFTGVELRRFTGAREIAPYTEAKTFASVYDPDGAWSGITTPYDGTAITSTANRGWAYFRTADPAVWPLAQLDFIEIKLTAKAIGATDQKLDICLTVDGGGCASRIVSTTIRRSSATYTLGDQTPVLEFWRGETPQIPFRVFDLRKTAGKLQKTGSALTWTGGNDLFNTNWTSASSITVGSAQCRIASVVNDKAITIQDADCVPDGDYTWAAFNFGVLMRRNAAATEGVTISNVSWVLGSSATVFGATAGAYDACQAIEVQGSTGPGYYCAGDSTAMEYGGARPLYWVGLDGTVDFLGLAIENLPDVAGQSPCMPLSQSWDSTVPGKFWCIGAGASGKTVIYSGRWKGVNKAQTAKTIASVEDSTFDWQMESQDVSAAVAAFDDRYRSFTSRNNWTLIGRSKDNLILCQNEGYQNSVSWLALWSVSAHSIIAATGTYNGGPLAANRWMGNHAVFPAGDVPAFMVHSDGGVLPYQATIESGELKAGPWQRCPENNVDPDLAGKLECSTVTVSSVTPTNPADGSNLYGQSWLAGDYAVVMRQNGQAFVKDGEQVRIILIEGNKLTLQRCPKPRRDFGNTVAHDGVLALAAVGSAWTQFWWNYEEDPHGEGRPTSYGNTVMDDPQAEDCHQVYMNGVYLVGCVKFTLLRGTAFKVGGFPDFLKMADADLRVSGYLNQNFAGQSANVDGFESHPSRQHYKAPEQEAHTSLDNSPYYGNTKYQPYMSKVPNTNYMYKLAAAGTADFDDKRLPIVVTSGYKVLVNVSPAMVEDASGDNYKYCRARAAGECWPDSQPGDLYANIPYASQANCFSTRFSPYPETHDFCVTNAPSSLHQFIQFGTLKNDAAGQFARALTSGFSPYKTESIYWNSRYVPDGSEAFFVVQNLDLARTETMLVRLPPFPADDSVNRTTFVPVKLSLKTPRDMDITNAVVDFGYAENGSPDQFLCTSRQDKCIANSGTIQENNPFQFATDGTGGVEPGVNGMPCTEECSPVIPAISGRILYYQVRYRDTANVTVATESLRVTAVP